MKYEQLKQKVRKAIKPQCEDCVEKRVYDTISGEYSVCKTCNGKGYIEELEFGCECKTVRGTIGYFLNDTQLLIDGEVNNILSVNYENLGKPLTLQEILLALDKSDAWYKNNGIGEISGEYNLEHLVYGEIKQKTIYFSIPLNLTPDQYDEELIDKLIEIL